MTVYTERHHEDMARILAVHDAQWRPVEAADSGKHRPVMAIANDFADLFAAANPACCTHCGALDSIFVCVSADGRCYEEHDFEGGFDREWFLKACGLER